MYGRKKPASSMDILYLLLPIIGAFLLLFLVCCFGKKVKEMLHIPKELVLGRNFPGLASSTSSSSSSRSSFSESDDDHEPAIVINVNMERQRVLSQHRRRYTQVPSDEMVFSLEGETDCHTQPTEERNSRDWPSRCVVLPIITNCQQLHRKSKTSHRRADSCPLLVEYHVRSSDVAGEAGSASGAQQEMTSYVNIVHAPYRLHPAAFFPCHSHQYGNLDPDSDSDTTSTTVPEKPDRRRHRSNSESDLPKRGSQYEQQAYLVDQRLSQCSHRLASTEFQLHAPQYCSSLLTGSDCDQCSNNQAEVG